MCSDRLRKDITNARQLLRGIDYRAHKYGVDYETSKDKKKEMEKIRTRAKKTLQEKEEPEGYIKGKMRYAKDNAGIAKLHEGGLFDEW